MQVGSDRPRVARGYLYSNCLGIRLQAVEARASVRDRLRAEGVDETLGGINRFTSVADAVEAL